MKLGLFPTWAEGRWGLAFSHAAESAALARARPRSVATSRAGANCRAAEELLRHVVERAAREEVVAQGRLETGDPPHAIDAAARTLGADVIVVGKVGRRGVRKWLVGSVTRRLIESTRVPVLVIADPEPPAAA